MKEFDSVHKTGFDRSGFQEDGTYIGQVREESNISSKQKREIAPEKGEIILTHKGAFKVEEVTETVEFAGQKYFRAKGELVD